MRLKLFIPVLVFLSLTVKINAQIDVNNAQAIFIYNFLSHVKWPDTDVGNKYVIGVLGKTPTFEYLKKYTSNRKVGNKTIEIVEYTSTAQVNNCQVLFVTHNKSIQMAELTAKLKGTSCLIVGEKPGAVKQGATVHFEIVSGKLRYKIDKQHAEDQNLFVSNQLMTMSL